MTTRLFLPLLLIACIPPPAMLAQQPSIDDLAAAHLSDLSPGVALALHHEGEVAFLDAWGVLRRGQADSEQADSLHTGTLFPAPGLTPFMVEAVLRALDDIGGIDLDQRLGLLLPDLEAPLADATLRQLLTHTAGLDDAEPRDDWSRETLLEDVRPNWFFTAPGHVVSFSRYSIPVAARVLELATARPLPELLESVLLEPLDMDRSTFDPEEAQRLGLAPGMARTDRPDTPVEEVDPTQETGALPVLFTTVTDLATLFGSWTGGGIRGTSPLDPQEPRLPGPPGLEGRVQGFSRETFRGTDRLRMVVYGLGSAVTISLLPSAGAAAVGWSAGRPPTRPVDFMVDRVADAVGLAPEPLRERGGGGSTDSGPDASGAAPAPPERGGPLNGPDLPGLAGTYMNGDRKIELRTSSGALTFFDGRSELELRLEGDRRLVAYVADGRPALSLYVVHDRRGRPYVYRGARGFARQAPEG